MPKTIVFFADGTWCSPGKDDPASDEGEPRLTNVCKLFGWLTGELDGAWGRKEMEKVLRDGDGSVVQMAKYIHGVGDSAQVLAKVNGGAFGIGVTMRIARGYTWLSRNFAPGDRIVIVGFSRGAYTARALAGLVMGQGLLRPELAAADDPGRYDTAIAAWYRWRHGGDSLLQRLGDDAIELAESIGAFAKAAPLTEASFVPAGLAAVAVWDTVGALGIPAFGADGRTIDFFQFCDTRLDPRVGLGLHAVSLDEERSVFQPTLWDDAPNATQVLFPGGHSDVGGGYEEHGLSDGPLVWFVDRLQHTDVGLLIDARPPTPVEPDPLGPCHREWTKPLWAVLGAHPREFRPGLAVDASVRQRMDGRPEQVFGATDVQPPYAPVNLP